MTDTASLLERLVPSSSRDVSVPARRWLAAHGLPSTSDEAWRYTPVDDILARLEAATPGAAAKLTRSDIGTLAGDHGGPRLVFVNGIHAPDLSDGGPLSAGAWCGSRDDAPARRVPPDADDLIDGFQALNRIAATPAVVLVDDDVDVVDPIHVVHVAAPGSGITASQPRTIVRAGRGSRLTVIETFCGLAGTAVVNASTSIEAGPTARVTHYRIQDEAAGTIHVGHTRVEQAERSDVQVTSVMTGADIARSAVVALLAGPDASIELNGLYLPAGDQRHDNVITVDHAASGCTSTQLFKGVIDDHARGSFSGRIIVRPGTVRTDARQLNHNLVLRPTAQADTRPWLEILADDVRCNHGASVGRLDDDALFYLRSRGIPTGMARSMLVDAFIAEITERISPPSLRDRLCGIASARSGVHR